jgi:hypothetical protein
LAKASTGKMSAEGTPVRYLRSFFIPGEDKCYCLFEAMSPDVVQQANDDAGLPYVAITEGFHVTAEELT